jgi:hypothetical protein
MMANKCTLVQGHFLTLVSTFETGIENLYETGQDKDLSPSVCLATCVSNHGQFDCF